MGFLDIVDIFSNYEDFFYSIGYFGEYITFIIACALLFNKYVYFVFYVVLFILNRVLNQFLKKLFKQPRPSNGKKFLDSDVFSKKKFGMPSGHSQLVFYTIAYSYLVNRQLIPWTLLLLVIGLIVIYERYLFKNHTMMQLISGAGVGILTAYITAIMALRYA